jgi:hypothetical protein
MKKIIIATAITSCVILFSYCSSSKKASHTALITYQTDVLTIVADKCSPCHWPEKGGKVKPLDTYEAVKTEIDDIIRRISLNPGEKGFMPFKHDKLSDSTIAIFKQWKIDGMREK